MSYKIGAHDFEVRQRAAEKFLGQGNKVKFSIQFKGREIAHSDVAIEVMNRMAVQLDNIGVIDAPPKVNGRQLIMMIAPKQINKDGKVTAAK